MPFTSRSAESANCSAGMVRKMKFTGILSTLKSTAIGFSCATAIRPPVATMVIITNEMQISAKNATVPPRGPGRVMA